MKRGATIKGFSKLSREEKIHWLCQHYFNQEKQAVSDFEAFQLQGIPHAHLFEVFSENTISTFPLPYGIAPNFVIDGKTYAIPMVTEESSVVAACSLAAKYWMSRGGFHTEVAGMVKKGQVHFFWEGPPNLLFEGFPAFHDQVIPSLQPLMQNMEKRGGGLMAMELISFHEQLDHYYTLDLSFDTCDSMGANFINSILEIVSRDLNNWLSDSRLPFARYAHEINMSILSNNTPECLVRAWVECDIRDLGHFSGNLSAENFAAKFHRAIEIASINPQRATTHNKGIFNGIDAVVLATGNDFRAVEAAGHTYAARDGQYSSLTSCTLESGKFRFSLAIPMAVGTVGGLTNLHPLAKRSLEMLGNPSAKELMSIIAAVGLAQNFSAVRSLITTGIQQGHMKLHLMNILHACGAGKEKISSAIEFFKDKVITFAAVRAYLQQVDRKS